MEKLAIFDVDYTLTKRETLIEFFMFMLKKNPKFIVYIPRAIVAGLLYGIKVFDEVKTKENFIKFIGGMEEEQVKNYVKEFYHKKLSKIIYKDAIETMEKLNKEGCKIYLISASPEFYLNELYNLSVVNKVIGSRFQSENGVYRNKIIGKNCKGEEKVQRLMTILKEENIEVDFKNSYMYSDSLSDLPLFKLVGHPYLINYKKKHPSIEILKWK